MAIIGAANFNRIIDIYFLDDAGFVKQNIICPRKGRKPTIEITGHLYPSMSIPAFNLTIKNLYIDMKGMAYPKIKVAVGYNNDANGGLANMTTIDGTILTIYQDSPGPEGTTVIQCLNGEMAEWLDNIISISATQGTPLIEVLNKITTSLKMKGPLIGAMTGSLLLKENLDYDGPARNGISKLLKQFDKEGLCITQRNNALCAFSLKLKDSVTIGHKLNFISAPPQQNTGDEAGAFYTTVTAPWDPSIYPGDEVEIPSWTYIKNYSLIGAGVTSQKIVATEIDFHFGTTGGTNSMTMKGYKA